MQNILQSTFSAVEKYYQVEFGEVPSPRGALVGLDPQTQLQDSPN